MPPHICVVIAPRIQLLMKHKLGEQTSDAATTILQMKAYEISLGDGSLSPIKIGSEFSVPIKQIGKGQDVIFDLLYLGESPSGLPRFFVKRFRWEVIFNRPDDKPVQKKETLIERLKGIKTTLLLISAVLVAIVTIIANLGQISESLKPALEITSVLLGAFAAIISKGE